jgi:hypothetical protein
MFDVISGLAQFGVKVESTKMLDALVVKFRKVCRSLFLVCLVLFRGKPLGFCRAANTVTLRVSESLAAKPISHPVSCVELFRFYNGWRSAVVLFSSATKSLILVSGRDITSKV